LLLALDGEKQQPHSFIISHFFSKQIVFEMFSNSQIPPSSNTSFPGQGSTRRPALTIAQNVVIL
jgi:hypothetical protein